MMSLRRKFTFPERQLKACREHLVLMQTETGATLKRCGHLCFAAASFPSRNQGWADAVLACAPQPQRVAMVLGHGARPRAADTVLACGARSRCSATVRGLGAWLWCSARCVNTVLGCVLVPSSGAWTRCSAGGVSAVFGHGARRSAVLWMRCSATLCVNVVLGGGAQPGRGTWCSPVVLRAGVRARHADTVLAQMVLRHRARCSDVVRSHGALNRVRGHSAWARCVDVVLRNSCSGVVLAHRSPTLCLNVVLRRGVWMWCRGTALSHRCLVLGCLALHKDLMLTPRARPWCLDPVHPNAVLAPPGPGAPFPHWNTGLWLRGPVAGDSWASRFSHLFIPFPPPRSPFHFFFGLYWCYFFPLGSRELRGQQPPHAPNQANTSTPHPAAPRQRRQ